MTDASTTHSTALAFDFYCVFTASGSPRRRLAATVAHHRRRGEPRRRRTARATPRKKERKMRSSPVHVLHWVQGCFHQHHHRSRLSQSRFLVSHIHSALKVDKFKSRPATGDHHPAAHFRARAAPCSWARIISVRDRARARRVPSSRSTARATRANATDRHLILNALDARLTHARANARLERQISRIARSAMKARTAPCSCTCPRRTWTRCARLER